MLDIEKYESIFLCDKYLSCDKFRREIIRGLKYFSTPVD